MRKKRAPTLYLIVVIKLLKGLLLVGLASLVYALADNNLPQELNRTLEFLRLDPEREFWTLLGQKLGSLTSQEVFWTASGTLAYSLFSLLEGTGLMFRLSWAGYLAIGESAFFIPIEVLDLCRHFSLAVLLILAVNILIVAYLYINRGRLFRHRRG